MWRPVSERWRQRLEWVDGFAERCLIEDGGVGPGPEPLLCTRILLRTSFRVTVTQLLGGPELSPGTPPDEAGRVGRSVSEVLAACVFSANTSTQRRRSSLLSSFSSPWCENRKATPQGQRQLAPPPARAGPSEGLSHRQLVWPRLRAGS